jgi:ABC-type lipoprotein release transport system permease subunit
MKETEINGGSIMALQKFPHLVSLAIKYLYRYRRRYLFLFLALSFGFGIVTLITAVRDGMYENVYNSAQGHYAGDIIAAGYDQTARPLHFWAEAARAVGSAIESSGIKPLKIVRRTMFGERGVLYYNGAALRLKYVTGVDWENESTFFSRLDWAEGPGVFGDSTVILSTPAAQQLGARMGDLLTLEVETRWGQKNTGSFIVGGIVNDSTIFGYYKVYISFAALNGLTLLGMDECSLIGIYVDRNTVEKKRRVLQAELEKISQNGGPLQTGPLVYDRDGLSLAATGLAPGVTVFLITIPVYLSEVADLLDAMNIITYFLYAMMLIIILVSALVTYRLILHERRRELGTMRAIGFYGADLRLVLLIETFGLAVASLAAGMILVLVLQWAVQFIPLTWFPSFEIFLKNGRLTARYEWGTMTVNVLSVFAALLFAAALPVWRASREALPEMLGGS